MSIEAMIILAMVLVGVIAISIMWLCHEHSEINRRWK